MSGTDYQVFSTCQQWLEAGQAVYLVTVVKTWGSSPRPVGSLLCVRGDGVVLGSVSGGCIEDDLIEQLCTPQVPGTFPKLINYGLDADEAHRFGLPCGGTVQLVVESLDVEKSALGQTLQYLCQQAPCVRVTAMDGGAVHVEPAGADSQTEFDGVSLRLALGPAWRLLIIGDGQMSRLLASIAASLDFQVSICDPRDLHEVAKPSGDAVFIPGMPDDAVRAMRPDARTAIVALTHDPKLDDMALMEALGSGAFYVGAIGSQATSAKRRQRLQMLDLSPAQIEGLHGPIGLDIGSRTPSEIAVSIAAHLIETRRWKLRKSW